MLKSRKKPKGWRKIPEIRQDLVEGAKALVKIGYDDLDPVLDGTIERLLEDGRTLSRIFVKGVDDVVVEQKNVNVSEKQTTTNPLCNPEGLPTDGVIEKRDFVCWPKNGGLVYFMIPKNPNQTPMTSNDGGPKFVKQMGCIKNFGQRTLERYLQNLAERYGLTVRRVNVKNPVEEIYQFC